MLAAWLLFKAEWQIAARQEALGLALSVARVIGYSKRLCGLRIDGADII